MPSMKYAGILHRRHESLIIYFSLDSMFKDYVASMKFGDQFWLQKQIFHSML